MGFHAGQRVECINDSPDCFGRPLIVVKGGRYTVTKVVNHICGEGLFLAGLSCGNAPGWSSTRFRPIVEDKSALSFTKGAPKDSAKWDNRHKRKVRA